MSEFEIMKTIDDLIKDLDGSTKRAIMSWLITKYGNPSENMYFREPLPVSTSSPSLSVGSSVSSRELAEDFARATPKTDKDKALFVAAFLQTEKKQETFTARDINDELKNLGYAIGNITRALDKLERAKPMLVIQVRRENKKQPRFKVTSEGLKVAKELLDGKLA